MSIVMNLALLVEMVLLSNSFNVVKSAVGVQMLPSYSNLYPPTHSRTLSGSDFVDLWVHRIVMYVTFLPAGTLERGMKNIVFVPIVLPYPCNNLPSYLHIPASHLSLYSSLCIRCLYSSIASVVSSITALAIH